VRIAYLVTRADPIGGVQIHVRDLAAAMLARGHATTVIIGGNGPLIDSLRAHDIPTILLRHMSVPINPMRDVRALREVHAVLRDLRPDLVAAHSSKAGVLGRLAGRWLQIPVVLTAHGWSFSPGIPRVPAAFFRQIERTAGPLTSKIITVSEVDRQLTLDAHVVAEDRVVAVHNGIADVGPGLRADPGRTPVRMVMVARFGAQKDHPTLFRALAGLMDQEWTLDLIGDGHLMTQTAALAHSLGLGERVRFLGQRTDVEQLLAEAQVSLLATNWEGLPLSILEAMRAGLPVIASDVGGISESVRDGVTGYLVPRGGVDLLRERIGRLLRDPGLRVQLGASARTLYERQFTLERFVSNTLAVYQEVLDRRKRTGPARPETRSQKIG
jgi:glycosyltransferase involved in cell wall biosynthesis